MLDELNMKDVREIYNERYACHELLRKMLRENDSNYFNLALGISNPAGNYSAEEHKIGPRITQKDQVVRLANSFRNEIDPGKMLDSIYAENIGWVKVGVGSEIAMMLFPDRFWVANVRTIWTHLLVKHNFELKIANEALKQYREKGEGQPNLMEYKKWRAIYLEMEPSIISICNESAVIAKLQKVSKGINSNLWFDAVANSLYLKFARGSTYTG